MVVVGHGKSLDGRYKDGSVLFGWLGMADGEVMGFDALSDLGDDIVLNVVMTEWSGGGGFGDGDEPLKCFVVDVVYVDGYWVVGGLWVVEE
jgi:hypothetical protein